MSILTIFVSARHGLIRVTNILQMKSQFGFGYEKYNSYDELPAGDIELLNAAFSACGKSYAPYSGFRVGAAARLASGRIITAGNQESEVFPAGLCAERTLLFSHMTELPDDKVEALAVISSDEKNECYPCGICRQTMLDVQRRQGQPFKVIMGSRKSATIIENAAFLLPFGFTL